MGVLLLVVTLFDKEGPVWTSRTFGYTSRSDQNPTPHNPKQLYVATVAVSTGHTGGTILHD